MSYEAVIGLEVHSELKTNTKIFCGCSTTFGGEQNTNVCPVCLGLPGVLPVINEKVVEFAIKAGLALNCQINGFSKFDRKNYYYPDLPKNFQTSQYDLPIAENGYLDIEVDGKTKRIGITKIHMEEDAFLPMKSINELRRQAISILDQELMKSYRRDLSKVKAFTVIQKEAKIKEYHIKLDFKGGDKPDVTTQEVSRFGFSSSPAPEPEKADPKKA